MLTVKTWKICDKYDLEVADIPAPHERGYRPYHTRSVWDISREAICKEALFKVMSPPRTVVEYFGGLGIAASLLRGVYNPTVHPVYELDSNLCGHLISNGFDAICVDSFKKIVTDGAYDLADVDFDIATALSMSRSPVSEFLDCLFKAGHRQIIITDAAISKLHLHKERYGTLLGGGIVKLEDYLNLLSHYFYRIGGYSISHCEYHAGACYLLCLPRSPEEFSINKSSASYAGVSIC